MSPRVQLVLYPDGDSAFASTTTMSLQIDLPDHYDPQQVILAIQKHLRSDYPLATIRAEPSDHDGYDATWHIYRDGYSALADEPA